MGFLTDFATGAMRGALAIQDEREKYAEDRFKSLEKLRDKMVEERSKADEKKATAIGLAKFHNVDPTDVLRLMESGFKGSDLIKQIERIQYPDKDKPKSDAVTQTAEALKPPAQGGASAAIPAAAPQVPSAPGTNPMAAPPVTAADAAPTPQAPTRPNDENGPGVLGVLNAALFGKGSSDRANDRFRDTYGQEGVDMVTKGSRSGLAEMLSKNTGSVLGPEKLDTTEFIKKVGPSDFRNASDYASFIRLAKEGKVEEAAQFVQGAQAKLAMETAAANSRAAYAAGLNKTFNGRLFWKDGAPLVTIDDNDVAKARELVAQGYNQVPLNYAGKLEDLRSPNKTEWKDKREAETAVRNMISLGRRLEKTLDRTPDAPTAVAELAKTGANLEANLKAAANAFGAEVPQFNPNDPKFAESMSTLRQMGYDNHEIKSTVLMLTYLTAGMFGQSGRDLSDNDVKHWLQVNGGDLQNPGMLKRAVNRSIDVAKDVYFNKLRVMEGAYPKDTQNYFNDTPEPTNVKGGSGADKDGTPPPISKSDMTEENVNAVRMYNGRPHKIVKDEKTGKLGLVPVK